MMVCDICLGAPEYNGSPVIRKAGNGGEEYLFQHPNDRTTSRVDLCEKCVELIRARAWDKIAERAHDVLMLRLGVPTRDSLAN
jgi:hypothetical protein